MKLVFVDLETGGLDPAYADITEIAAIVDVDGVVVEEFEILMSATHVSRLQEEALHVQGKTADEIMKRPMGQRDGYTLFKALLERHKDPGERLTWAGQNPEFDKKFARAMFKGQGDAGFLGRTFNHTPVDLATLAVALRIRGHLPGLVNHRLASIMAELNFPAPQTHRALDDIHNTRACFYRLLDKIPLGT